MYEYFSVSSLQLTEKVLTRLLGVTPWCSRFHWPLSCVIINVWFFALTNVFTFFLCSHCIIILKNILNQLFFCFIVLLLNCSEFCKVSNFSLYLMSQRTLICLSEESLCNIQLLMSCFPFSAAKLAALVYTGKKAPYSLFYILLTNINLNHKCCFLSPKNVISFGGLWPTLNGY